MATNKRLIKSNDEAAVGGDFNTVLYSGNSSTQSITTVGFAPDLTWIKERTGTDHHRLQDTVRGAGYRLYSSTTSAEGYTNDSITSFNADGFSLGGSLGVNESGKTYVAWCWKAGGAAVTNTDGTTPSQVSANTEAGFSIVTWTTNLSPATLRVGHGLGQTPDIVIFKRRSSPNEDWYVLSNLFDGSYLLLNSTSALTSLGSSYSTSVTDTLLSSFTSAIGIDYVAYCFAEVAGFSKFGSYSGNSSANGPVIECGFEPAFVIIKGTDAITNWSIYDNKRDTSNPRDHILWTNLSDAELVAYPQTDIDFNATNFQLKGTNGGINQTGRNYIYMAFANQF